MLLQNFVYVFYKVVSNKLFKPVFDDEFRCKVVRFVAFSYNEFFFDSFFYLYSYRNDFFSFFFESCSWIISS